MQSITVCLVIFKLPTQTEVQVILGLVSELNLKSQFWKECWVPLYKCGRTMPVLSKEARVIIIWLAQWICLKTAMILDSEPALTKVFILDMPIILLF